MEQNEQIISAQADPEDEEGETVCYCFDVPDTVIRRVIRENDVEEVDQVTEICNAGGGCTSCHPDIEEMIDEYQESKDGD